jgi:hypothetical protein
MAIKPEILTFIQRSIQRSPSHTPGLGALVANLVVSQIDVRDGLIDFKCLGQGLETETEQGWTLVPALYRQILITEILRIHNMQI